LKGYDAYDIFSKLVFFLPLIISKTINQGKIFTLKVDFVLKIFY
jgi:hypothetical protein